MTYLGHDWSASSETPVPFKRLEILAKHHLAQNGLLVKTGTSMHEYEARTVHHGRKPAPQYMEVHQDLDDAFWVMIFDGGDQLLGSITIRYLETDDFMRDIETGHYAYLKPEANGWHEFKSGLRPEVRLSGTIASRGGINAYVTGKSLSGWLATFAMIDILRHGIDYQVGVALPAVGKGVNGRPSPVRFYGYAHDAWTDPIQFYYAMDKPGPCRILWSTESEVVDELRHRERVLEMTGHEDLRATAEAFHRVHGAEERAVHELAAIGSKLPANNREPGASLVGDT